MPNIIGSWRDALYVKSTGATATKSSEPVRPSDRWYAQAVSVRNRTNATAVVDVYIDTGGTAWHLTRIALTVANQWYDYKLESWLGEGEALRFDWSAVNNNDELDMHIVGQKRYDPTMEWRKPSG